MIPVILARRWVGDPSPLAHFWEWLIHVCGEVDFYWKSYTKGLGIPPFWGPLSWKELERYRKNWAGRYGKKLAGLHGTL